MLDTKKQSTMYALCGFTDAIIAQTEKKYSQLGDTNMNNAICMGAIGYLCSCTC